MILGENKNEKNMYVTYIFVIRGVLEAPGVLFPQHTCPRSTPRNSNSALKIYIIRITWAPLPKDRQFQTCIYFPYGETTSKPLSTQSFITPHFFVRYLMVLQPSFSSFLLPQQAPYQKVLFSLLCWKSLTLSYALCHYHL